MAALSAGRGDLRHFLRFAAVGALNTLVGYLLFATLTLIGLGPNPAVVGSTVLGILFNFQSFGRLVFGGAAVRLLPRFLAAYAVLTLVNIGLLHLVIAREIGQLPAQAIVLPPVVLLNFLLMRRFVFRSAPAAETVPL